MKQIITIVIVVTVFTLSACGQHLDAAKVPDTVKKSFAKQFPGATTKWEKEGNSYEATFKNKGNKMSASFNANGTMIESELEINIAELPASIKDYIKSNYSGAKIKEAAIITLATGESQYEAEIKGKDLIFDISGKFIKEIKL